MDIDAYLLANHTKEVPVPVPVDPVSAPITLSQTVRYDHYMYKPENEDRGVVYPAYGANLSETRSWGMLNPTSSGEYYAEQGEDCVPCNCGGGGNASSIATFHPNGDGFWNGRHHVYYYMNYFTPNGSITIDVSSLPTGKYVLEVLHWFGYDDKTSESSLVRVDGNKGRVIKGGTHGVIEGIVFPEPVHYTGESESGWHNYRGYVVKARLRYAFTVNTGDTTKTFEFGAGKEISFTDLWDCVYMYEMLNGVHDFSVWANCHTSFHIKVYKGG